MLIGRGYTFRSTGRTQELGGNYCLILSYPRQDACHQHRIFLTLASRKYYLALSHDRPAIHHPARFA